MKKHLSFRSARKLIRLVGLKSQKDWLNYSGTLRPDNIPSRPYKYYENGGWISLMDFCGYDKKTNRKRNVNNNYFKKWSSNMAYVLGLWFADGYINERRNDFNLSQHNKDAYLLRNILKEMDADYPLIKNGNNFDFHISSKTIVKDIIRLGGKQRKSLDVKFPYVPKKYLPDFIRGLWDGDGSVNKHGAGYRSSYTSGSKKFAYGFLKILRENISGFRSSIYKVTRKKGTIQSNNKPREKDQISYYLEINRNDTRRLRNFMYKDVNCLKLIRKYKLFLLAGEINISTSDKKFLSFEDAKIKAKNVIKRLGISSSKKWFSCFKLKQIPIGLPCRPNCIYKNKGWTDWRDFLGISKNNRATNIEA